MSIVVAVIAAALSLFTAYSYSQAGLMKAKATKQDLLNAGFGWMEKQPQAVGKLIGWLEILGSAGLVLGPLGYFLGFEWSIWFGIAAALGLALIMIGAIIVHAVRKETPYTIKMNMKLFLVAFFSAVGWVAFLGF